MISPTACAATLSVKKPQLGFVLLLGLCLPGVVAASMSEKLAKAGFPETELCQFNERSLGLGGILVLRFKSEAPEAQALQSSIEILGLLVDALNDTEHLFFALDASKDIDGCAKPEPQFVFWRDYDSNWRYVRENPQKYLKGLKKKFSEMPENATHAAYVDYSLGSIRYRLGKHRNAVKLFDRAYDLLRAQGDPNGIKQTMLPLLIQHYLKKGDESKGQVYLEEYARVVRDNPIDKSEYIPLIKVAPRYPPGAFHTNREGYVILEFTVDDQGRVQNPVVVEESPKGVFGQAAIDAANSFRYLPAVVDGVRVPTQGVRNRITFEIQ